MQPVPVPWWVVRAKPVPCMYQLLWLYTYSKLESQFFYKKKIQDQGTIEVA